MQKKTSLLGNLPLSHEKGEAGFGKKKHQERFPVVIRLPISNETIPDILCEIKIAITFECQADSNKSSKQNICLENYSKFNTSYCFSLSYRNLRDIRSLISLTKIVQIIFDCGAKLSSSAQGLEIR